MSRELRMDEKGWYKFYFNSKPDEYGEIHKYEIHFQYRTGTDNERIFNSVKMLNDCEEDILYFDSENCKVSQITSVPTKYTIIGIKGTIEFLNKVIQKLKENGKDTIHVWHFNEKHYNTPMDELMKLVYANEQVKEKYNDLFNRKSLNQQFSDNSPLKTYFKNKIN